MTGGIPALHDLRMAVDAGGFLAVVVLVTLVWLLVVRLLRARETPGPLGARLGGVVAMLGLWVALAGVAELTLYGTQGLGADPRLQLDPLAGAWGWSGIAWRPVIDNVTLFVPVGAGLAAVLRRQSLAVPLGLAIALSVAVETFQWAVPSGRIANSADVVANTLGAVLGIVLAVVTGARRERPVRREPARGPVG
jgi:hypothetical protein